MKTRRSRPYLAQLCALTGLALWAGVPAVAAANAKINFQPDASALPAGFSKDIGMAFDGARGYGWVTEASLATATHAPLDLRPNTRDRARAGIPAELNTVLQFQDPIVGGLGNGCGPLHPRHHQGRKLGRARYRQYRGRYPIPYLSFPYPQQPSPGPTRPDLQHPGDLAGQSAGQAPLCRSVLGGGQLQSRQPRARQADFRYLSGREIGAPGFRHHRRGRQRHQRARDPYRKRTGQRWQPDLVLQGQDRFRLHQRHRGFAAMI
jgi:hypothetical protein